MMMQNYRAVEINGHQAASMGSRVAQGAVCLSTIIVRVPLKGHFFIMRKINQQIHLLRQPLLTLFFFQILIRFFKIGIVGYL